MWDYTRARARDALCFAPSSAIEHTHGTHPRIRFPTFGSKNSTTLHPGSLLLKTLASMLEIRIYRAGSGREIGNQLG